MAKHCWAGLNRRSPRNPIPAQRAAISQLRNSVSRRRRPGQLRDRASIPLIIEACKKSNPDQARALAASLKYFDDDPLAKGVVAIYFPTPDPVEALKRDSNRSEDSETALSYDIEQVVKAHAVQAIPILEQMFDQRRNDVYKPLPSDASGLSDREKYELSAHNLEQSNEQHIASALIRPGVKNNTYWNYVADQARLALDLDPPCPFQIDANGQALPDPSPAFVAWTKTHNTTIEAAVPDAMYVFPGKMLELARAGDPRGIPLLRQALLSRNCLVRSAGADGLAKLHDKDSIPLIIESCNSAKPPEAAEVIARSLLFFDDPEAQAAAGKYIPAASLKALRQSKALLATQLP